MRRSSTGDMCRVRRGRVVRAVSFEQWFRSLGSGSATCGRRTLSTGASGGFAMEPRIDVITLAVADLDRALAFYRDGLGLPTRGIVGTEWPGDERTPAGAVAMFELRGGALLCCYPRTELAKDACIDIGPARSGE